MTKVKIAVSLPQEQVAAAKRAVAEGRAASVSAYVSQALEKYDARSEMLRILDEWDEEYGPPGPEVEAWVDEVFKKVDELRRRGGYPPR
ncbi:MAG: ribbon-helix-helix domain-containing protein [Jiangellaceae bacterium]